MVPAHRERLFRFMEKAVSCPTCNPPGGERPFALFIQKYLRQYGIRSRLVECCRGRSNVIACLKSEYSKKAIVVSPHLDTVPAPVHLLSARFSAGRIYGRGATDCKGNVGAAIESLIMLSRGRQLKNIDVVFCATADEEAGSKKGLIPILQRKLVRGDFWLALDSDDFDIVTAQKGLLHMKVTFHGKTAHASVPSRGRNAIVDAALFIRRIYAYSFPHKKHALLRAPTVNVGTIHGGEKVNMVAGECAIEIDIRYLPSMKETDIIHTVKALARQVSPSFTVEVTDMQKPIEYHGEHWWISALKHALKKNHIPCRLRGSEGATVMSILHTFGFPAAGFGFGAPFAAHSDNEYVRLDNLCRGAQVLYDYFVELDDRLNE